MKKIISLLLVFVIAFSITACNSSKKGEENNFNATLPLDVEELKANWKSGELVFENKNVIKIPCAVEELEKSGLKISNGDYATKVLKPDETYSIHLVGENIYISLKCKNTTDADVECSKATVYQYNLSNGETGNRTIKFAGTLTPGVVRADLEKALGLPEGKTSEDVMYIYTGRNTKNKKVTLRVTFNSIDIVNSVAFEVNV